MINIKKELIDLLMDEDGDGVLALCETCEVFLGEYNWEKIGSDEVILEKLRVEFEKFGLIVGVNFENEEVYIEDFCDDNKCGDEWCKN